jgi:hypothetical protein
MIPCYTAKRSHSIFRILQTNTLMTLLKVKVDKETLQILKINVFYHHALNMA